MTLQNLRVLPETLLHTLQRANFSKIKQTANELVVKRVPQGLISDFLTTHLRENQHNILEGIKNGTNHKNSLIIIDTIWTH